MSAVIGQKLQSSRKELLDIGLRNNMLNFRKTAKTSSPKRCSRPSIARKRP
ncbi:MAG: hypothetical protein K0S77_3225 [Pseudomonas sp.]|nr:hypothetical protein [Pseudomonas sp.]